jgi:hypothetical protein
MTTRNRILIAAVLLAIPILLRLLFFYQAPYTNLNIQKPDFAQNTVPEPPTPSSKVAVVAGIASGKVTLIDDNHGNQFDPSEIEPLVTAISARGANVEFDNGAKPLDLKLKYASAYIVFAPSTAFSGDELRIIQQFVASGGRLLVFADPTRALTSYDSLGNPSSIPDVNYSNPLIAPFGLTLVNDYLYNLDENEGNFRNVKFTDFADDPLTKDLKMVVFYGAHSVHAEAGMALATGDEKTISSLTDRGGGLSAIAISANKQVLAAGDFTFMTNPFNQVADNALLLAHIANFVVGGERKPALVNFPYLFQHPVSLIATGELQLTSESLGPISSLQKSLNAVNIPVNIRSQALDGDDLIVLGTFKASDDLAPYVRTFNIDLENVKDAIEIPGVGKISSSGNGILLFNRGPKSNTLTLLAPTAKDLPGLITLVASGDLSSCVLQENIGVCALGSSSSSSDYFGEATPTPVESGTPSKTKSSTPTPTSTPTASG